MTLQQETAARRLIEALAAPPGEFAERVRPLLAPSVRLMRLGKSCEGIDAVTQELQDGANGQLSRRLDWAAPEARPDGSWLLDGRRRAGSRDRGLIFTLGFEDERIALLQQQRTAPPPPELQPMVLPASLRQMIDRALVERHPMLVAHSDADGQPVMSFRGSVQVYADDQLALWIRSAEGGFIQAITHNPKVALVYRNEDSKATYMFRGRARVSALDSDRRRIFDAAPEVERGHDFARLGVAVLIDLDQVEGYAGLGPAGQVDQIRLRRGAAGTA